MNRLVQVVAADDAKAWAILVRQSPGKALPNRVFLISKEAVKALREAGIHFRELPNDGATADLEGVMRLDPVREELV